MEEIIAEKNEIIFASRKKRLLSFIIDIFIIGLFGYLTSLVLDKFYIKLGGFGRIIGFLITWLYFSLFDSEIFNGQTIGKKIFKVKVVSTTSNVLTLKESFFRSVFYSLTILLNGLSFPSMKYLPFIITVGIILFSIYIVESFLFIFNKPSHQTLHDLLSKSYVVNVGSNSVIDGIKNKRIIRFALFIPLFITVAVIGLNIFMKNTVINEMLPLVDNIQNQLPLRNTVINKGITKYPGTNGKNDLKYIQISSIKLNQSDNSDELAVKIAEIVLNTQIDIQNDEPLIIQISYGFDIGIAKKYVNNKYNRSLLDWQNDIDQME